jgi:hypothetical protein
VCADEVPARAPWNDGELDIFPAGDSVDDLVDGSVAAEDDEQLGALVGGLPREVSELARALGEDRLAANAGRVRGAGELGPAPSGLAVRGRGVDEKDGLQCQGLSRRYTPPSGPRSRCAGAGPPPCQGCQALARLSAHSGLVLATQKRGSIT